MTQRRYTRARLLAATACIAFAATGAVAQSTNYVIGPQDGLSITVWNQADLGGDYTVEADGTFAFPLVGRVRAGGLTIREFEAELVRLLAAGYFNKPQVTVSIGDYRSQRIFVMGAVREPGTYSLTGGMTLIEALASAGSTTATAAQEVLVVQVRRNGTASRPGEDGGPTHPDESDETDVIRVDIEALQSGRAATNVVLRDGDTVFVPLAKTIYVLGEVNSPGEFPLRRPTTILQALALAGGVTEFGATNRIKLIRLVEGEQHEYDADLDTPVQADDTIVVPERYI